MAALMTTQALQFFRQLQWTEPLPPFRDCLRSLALAVAEPLVCTARPRLCQQRLTMYTGWLCTCGQGEHGNGPAEEGSEECAFHPHEGPPQFVSSAKQPS